MVSTAQEIEERLLDTAYLRSGNPRQRLAADTLDSLALDAIPGIQAWALAGTVPLDVDLPDSDLDILVCADNPAAAREELVARFSQMPGFSAWAHGREHDAWCVAFDHRNYPVEFFIQNTPLRWQRAFRHLLAEYLLLDRHGEDLRRRIHGLKASGVKTEPAFAQALGLDGDPYLALLEPTVMSDFR